ncbi:MAG: GTPase-associated protein 1-related protein [Pseudonocardiaceae bacterium]
MTENGFLSLYYTDCRPGQGLRGGAGFQFQAVSQGVDHDAMTLVTRSALYEAPVSWMREHRAVSSYPPSLTHVFDGVYVTARGIYLGAEANGVREGNQFTHAVTTGDPEAYGLIRPAQLWEAPWWSEQPSAGTECDPVPAQPEQGPWGIDAIREWVLGQPDAEDWLTAVSSAFYQAQEENRRRVLFVGEDAAAILGWIAAGTLLLPQSRALRLGFRVFATNPQYSQHDVLGLHPDWAGPFANPDRDGEFVVFSLDSGKHSVVEPAEAAAYWAPRFLRNDPWDVMDAVELAHKFARQRQRRADPTAEAVDARSSTADRLASAVVVLDEPVPEGHGLARWLAGQPSLSLEDIVEPVTEAVLNGPTDATMLAELDDAIQLRNMGGQLTRRIRRELLAAELGEVLSGRKPHYVDSLLPRRNWPPAEQRSATELVEQTAAKVQPDQLDLVLRIATRFRIEPTVANFRDAANQFVIWWTNHPTPALNPDRWPCGPLLVDLLRDELTARRDATTRKHVHQHWWRILLPISDLSSPLDADVTAAAFELGPPEVRYDVLAKVLEFVTNRDRPDTGELAWDALFRYASPRTGELLELLNRLRPDTISPLVTTKAWQALAALCRSRLTGAELDAVARLTELGGKSGDSRLAELRRQDEELRRWLASLTGRAADQAGKHASTLVTVTETVLDARRSKVLNAVLDDLPLGQALQMLNDAGNRLRDFLVRELPALWNDESYSERQVDTAVAIAYLATRSGAISDELTTEFDDIFKNWARDIPLTRVSRVEQLLKAVDPELPRDWLKYVAAALPWRRRAEVTRKLPSPAKDAAPEQPGSKQSKTPRWPFGRRGGGT